MPQLKAFYDSLDEIPAEHRGLYVEEDVRNSDGSTGKRWKANLDGLEDVRGLKSALEKTKEEARLRAAEAAAAAEAAEELKRTNKEAYDRIQSELKAREQREAEIRDAAQREVDARTSTLKAQVEDLGAKLAAERKARHDLFARQQLSTAILEQKGRPRLLLSEMMSRARVVEDPDAPDGLRLDYFTADGKPLLGDGSKPGTAKDLVREFRESDDFGVAFEGALVSGGGAGGGGGGRFGGGGMNGAKANPWKADTFNLTEQGRLLREDRRLAEKLALEAGKAIPPEV